METSKNGSFICELHKLTTGAAEVRLTQFKGDGKSPIVGFITADCDFALNASNVKIDASDLLELAEFVEHLETLVSTEAY
jgi:hypothetical protein